MKEFTLIFKNGTSEEHHFPDKNTLIAERFGGSEEQFRAEVQRLLWNSLTMHYVEDVQANKIHALMDTADINPYGWRDA